MNYIFILLSSLCIIQQSCSYYTPFTKFKYGLQQVKKSNCNINLIPEKFQIKSREIRKEIKIAENVSHPVQNMTGFYGLIGPDIDKFTINNLYDLLTGDGMIQGVFFDNGTITFIKHFVRTDKILYEEKHGRFSKRFFMTVLYMILNKMNMLPNVMGLANTALMKIDHTLYALFEQDLPYELQLDFENKEIKTIKKKKIKNMEHFSGHSKYIGNKIHTLDYDPLTSTVKYILLDEYFNILKKVEIRTMYLPIIHDFHVFKNGIIFIDSPFTIDMTKHIPVTFKKSPTYIHVYKDFSRTQYMCEEPFYMFHYAQVKETEKTYEILGSQYDSIDFNKMELNGKYRKTTINKKSGKVFISKNRELEKMNLDFPVKWEDKIILRSIQNRLITGFVVCRGLDIIKKLPMPENRFVCGEPAIITPDGAPSTASYLIGFAYDSIGHNYFFFYPLNSENMSYSEIPLSQDINLTIGFHSIFIPR